MVDGRVFGRCRARTVFCSTVSDRRSSIKHKEYLRELTIVCERLGDETLSSSGPDDSVESGVTVEVDVGVGVVVVAPIVISVVIVWPRSFMEVTRVVIAVAPCRGYNG